MPKRALSPEARRLRRCLKKLFTPLLKKAVKP